MIKHKDRIRSVILVFGLLCLFSLLLIKFYKIQVIEGEIWQGKADLQHKMFVKEPFRRGTFYSNTSIKEEHPEKQQIFVIDVPKYHLYIDPISIPREFRHEISEKLLLLTEIPNHSKALFREQFDKRSRSRKLVMWLDPNKKDEIRDWWRSYIKGKKIAGNAIFFVSDYQRSYPFGRSLGQVLHTIRDTKDEVTKQGIPTGGLEFYFNKYLQGQQGKRWLLRSPRSPIEAGEVITPPIEGADIYLSVNHCLQAIAEEEIAKGVQKVNAKGGWAVMMDPFTGEILALAQYPFFNPEDYQNYYNNPELQEHTRVKAITDAFEPGSIIKPITLSIGLTGNLEKHFFSPEEEIPTTNGMFPGRRRPFIDTTPYDKMNLYLAMQKSSNIYVATIAKRIVDNLGNKWYRHALKEIFAFSKKTEIELPGETSGFLPTIGKTYSNGKLQWSLSTPYSLAIGYNLQVNSIQMLRAYAALANGGILVQPTFIRKIVRTLPNGEKKVLLDYTGDERLKSFPQVLDYNVVEEIVKDMKGVIKGGSGVKADIKGYSEAGKTGTSKKIVNGKYSNNYFSSFIGFAPADRPRFVLFIGIDEPSKEYVPGVGHLYYGSKSAAPVFKEIAKRSLAYLGVSPDEIDND